MNICTNSEFIQAIYFRQIQADVEGKR